MTQGQNKRGILLSFSSQMDAPAPQTSGCFQCEKLERQYKRSIREISHVVRTRFPVLGDKLRELHKWQDMRDSALDMFYEHNIEGHRIRRTIGQEFTNL